MDSSQAGKQAHLRRDTTHHSFVSDWNSDDEFFEFTRGRFIVNEAENFRKRETRFDLKRLASIAAESVGAARCVSIRKYPDDMFNKAFVMFMEDGQEVVAKVPNPNAGVPHFTTASEVATMDFVRSSLTLSMLSLADATQLEGQKSSRHTSASCLHMELARKFAPGWGRIYHHGQD